MTLIEFCNKINSFVDLLRSTETMSEIVRLNESLTWLFRCVNFQNDHEREMARGLFNMFSVISEERVHFLADREALEYMPCSRTVH